MSFAKSLRVFKCGTLKSQKHLFTAGRGLGEPFEVPVPFFLVEHAKGLVLFDTGNAAAVAHDKVKHWGGAVKAYDPQMSQSDYCVDQLKRIGVDAAAITHVILSHLHLDHAGGVGDFVNALHIVQQAEMEFAYVPPFFQKGAYIRADFDKPHLKWKLLHGEKDDFYDVFGDGALTVIHTPGHTPGHQSLMVNLKKNGRWVLTGDCAYTEEIMNEDILPGLVWSPMESIRSISKLRDLRDKKDAHIVTGHDPDAFAKLKLAPEFYD